MLVDTPHRLAAEIALPEAGLAVAGFDEALAVSVKGGHDLDPFPSEARE